MGELEDKLSSILSDPEAMSKLQTLGRSLGLDTGGLGRNVSPAPAPSPVSSLFSQKGDDLSTMLMRLAPLLSDMGKDDETACLLNALKPFLSKPRQQRLEQAGKMLRVMKLLPVIKNTGLI